MASPYSTLAKNSLAFSRELAELVVTYNISRANAASQQDGVLHVILKKTDLKYLRQAAFSCTLTKTHK